MENNLYYTPTIEEFHVGFEYEEKIKFTHLIDYDGTWKHRIFKNRGYINGTTEFICINYDLDGGGNNVRVKVLDQSDIESLGWNLVNTIKSPFTGKPLTIHQKTEEHGFNTGINHWLIQQDNNWVIKQQVYSSYKPGEWAMEFNIKNLSELKKLQQKLNIK